MTIAFDLSRIRPGGRTPRPKLRFEEGRAPTARPAAVGLAVGLLFFGCFGTWAAVAPLESAALAPGTVVVDTNRKTVQHLEGGIVAELLVQDGARVEAGQVLLRLDETLARATRQLLQGQLRATAAAARLVAERDEKAAIAFPGWLLAAQDDADVAQVLAGERHIFAARREALESQTRILRQRNAQIDEEIAGLAAEIKAQDRQLTLIAEEAASVGELVAKGLERRPRLLALQRQAAEIEGARAQNLARVARAKQSIGENEIRIVDLRVQALNEAVQKLREAEVRLHDFEERIRAADDVLARTTIRAPVSGRIVKLSVFTAGGVVAPREPLMEIVPDGDALVIEAQVAPGDIDVVTAGLPVQLRFTALNQRTTPTFNGRVVQVSADRLADAQTGQAYYTARIVLEDDLTKHEGLRLYPGMPVEAMIVTGERTALDYLLKPIRAGLNRAMREE